MGNRDAGFAYVVQSMWTPDSSAADANREWVRNAWSALKRFSTGGNYVNFQTDDEPGGADRAVVPRQPRPPARGEGPVRPDEPLPGESRHPRLTTLLVPGRDGQRAGRRWGHGPKASFLDAEGDARVREAYPAPTHQRLAEIKARWDAGNVLRRNQNIQPAT